jgi:hypothetical protein
MHREIALSLWERGDREAVGEGTTPAGFVTQFRNPQLVAAACRGLTLRCSLLIVDYACVLH